MARTVKGGLIQASNPIPGDKDLQKIKQSMLDKHIPLIEQAGEQGVEVLCLQEIFYGPYFCPSQDSRWYTTAEAIPDGETTQMMMELAQTVRHGHRRTDLRRGDDGRLLQHRRCD